MFDDALKMKLDRRVFKKVTNQDLYLARSSSNTVDTDVELYQKISNLNFINWEDYINAKSLLYFVSPSQICPTLYFCTCPVGIKKKPCKHSVYVMQFIKKTLMNPYSSTPLEGKRKRGRPSRALPGNALSKDK
jgi:hypothetical protein